MDLRRVRAFRAIVEAGSLTKAAGILTMTAGALSKSMRQLEREVGQTLLVKQGRGLRLTDHGSLLYRVSGPLVEEHNRVRQQLDASVVTPERTLRLATYEVFSTHVLAALLEHGLADHPLEVHELGVGGLERAIAGREADIGLTYLPAPRPGLTFRALGAFSFQIYRKRGAFAATAFADLPFAVPMASLDENLGDALAIDCWPYERVPRKVTYRLTSLESALALCRSGHCAVFLPDFVARCHNRAMPSDNLLVTRRPPPQLGPIQRQVHLVYRDADAGMPIIERVAAAAAAVLKNKA